MINERIRVHERNSARLAVEGGGAAAGLASRRQGREIEERITATNREKKNTRGRFSSQVLN